jgi:hypothetical protein
MGLEINFSMTKHAQCRLQQRGIRPEILSFVISHADVWLHAGNGLETGRLSQYRLSQLSTEGHSASIIERAKNVVALYDPSNGSVVTVLHDHNSGSGKQYRKQQPTRGNRVARCA